MYSGNSLYDSLANSAISAKGISSQVAQIYNFQLFQKTTLNMVIDTPLGVGDAPRIRVGDITSATGQVTPKSTPFKGQYYQNFLFISCDQANNIYNSASKNAPIVAELAKCDD